MLRIIKQTPFLHGLLLSTLLLTTFSPLAWSEKSDFSEYKARVAKTTDEADLSEYDSKRITDLHFSDLKKIKRDLTALLDLVGEISRDESLNRDQKAELLAPSIVTLANSFEKLTDPYENPHAPPATWEELNQQVSRGRMPTWLRFVAWPVDRLRYLFQEILRDLLATFNPIYRTSTNSVELRLPSATWVFGRDSVRYAVVKSVTNQILALIREGVRETQKANNPKSNPESLQNRLWVWLFTSQEARKAIASGDPSFLFEVAAVMLESIKEAEPVRFESQHSLAKFLERYVAAPLFFLNPPVEYFFYRSTFSAFFSGLINAGFLAYILPRARNISSGLKFGKIINRQRGIHRSLLEQQWCRDLLEEVDKR